MIEKVGVLPPRLGREILKESVTPQVKVGIIAHDGAEAGVKPESSVRVVVRLDYLIPDKGQCRRFSE